MASGLNRHKLQQFVGDMVALERQIEAVVGQGLQEVAAQPKAAEVVRQFHTMVGAQRAALEARLRSIGGKEPGSPRIIAPAPFTLVEEVRTGGRAQGAARVLHALYTAFNHAAIGYAMLHAMAHRFYDSQGAGNTADLAEAHLRGYAAAAQEINQLISDVVVWELGQAGEECRCLCPSCGVGVCLCGPHGTNTVNQAWRETSRAAAENGLLVRPPRANSAVARAGLREGDRIIAVDDQEIASDLDAQSMQAAVRKHQSGEEIRLRVRRGTGELLEINVTRP
jgi:hypothetical protein